MTLVAEAMNRSLVTVPPGASMAEAIALVRRTGAEHVLVMDELTLVGIFCASDLRGARPEGRVSDCMREPVMTVRPDVRVEEAAVVLCASEVGCLPVALGGLILGTLSAVELGLVGITGPRPQCRHTHRRRSRNRGR